MIGLDAVAAIYRAQGRSSEAEASYQRMLTILKRALGPTHPDVALALEEYAALLRMVHRCTEASPLETRAQAIRATVASTQRLLAGWNTRWTFFVDNGPTGVIANMQRGFQQGRRDREASSRRRSVP